ncbi:thyrotropin receptor-like [Haliotis rufescens]|uniref:thyrotropin receptor-like n=1 Tax=Haliotis rufescens TaxID=6454 RepID=UPI00201F2077|nr:thyrotropin receptor-like [Haliotis rufescens]
MLGLFLLFELLRLTIAEETFCWKVADNAESVTCKGENITEIPNNLSVNITKLHLSNTRIGFIPARAFERYKKIRELHIRNFTELETIAPGAFKGMSELRILWIIDCEKLHRINKGVLGGFKELNTLKIMKSGLQEVPDFSRFNTSSKDSNGTMYEIDLSTNRIKSIPTRSFSKVKSYVLRLENNELETVEDSAFSGAQIAKLEFRNNPHLSHMGERAFVGIRDLISLNLSKTSITNLPTEGLENIEEINVEDTPTLKTFPPVLTFSSMKVARLYYAHHCCAFQHPEKQDPELWRRVKEFQEKLKKECSMTPSSTPAWPSSSSSSQIPRDLGAEKRSKRFATNDGFWGSIEDLSDDTPDNDGFGSFGLEDPFGKILPEGSTVASRTTKKNVFLKLGYYVNVTLPENETILKEVQCGNVSINYRKVLCTPQPNALNPCEDVMGYEWLRVFVWFVLLATLCGNVIVIIVIINGRSKMTVPKFLMCNLSFADFIMGLYLLLLASIDAHSLGEYFNHAVYWQNDGGCQVAGFLTVFSSELSVFVLMVITMERWYAISYAIHLTKRLRLRQASCLMVCGWMYAVIMASLPLLGVSSYGTVSICLPMQVEGVLDKSYIFSILLLNGTAFIVICGCYVSMYFKVKDSDSAARSNDATIAKRMSLLVFTNFACWAPIAFFGLTAGAGFPLIDITKSKILLVFFYPLNSCANPFLYVILTKQFRKDVFILLGRYGICTERANQYKGTYMSRSMSQSKNNGLVLHNVQHPSSMSMLSHLTQSHKGSKMSLNGSTPKATPQSTPATTPVITPKVSPISSGGASPNTYSSPVLLSPGDKPKERKLSTVPETSQILDDFDGQDFNTEVPEVYTEFVDDDDNDQGEKRVRSASEYVILYPANQRDARRRSGRLSCDKQSSLDTNLSSNTETSFLSDSSYARQDSTDGEAVKLYCSEKRPSSLEDKNKIIWHKVEADQNSLYKRQNSENCRRSNKLEHSAHVEEDEYVSDEDQTEADLTQSLL